ncbi:protein FAM98A [Chanos chanos]|uniref:Protein FAM98A n=1 Tax=Chanos chanos TaxID=29144 RepID=A0A6J2WWG5_CHACN|nr:protein FAM98A-like [Chanos chanos]
MERDIGTVAAIKNLGYQSGVCMRECRCDELPCPLITWLVRELRATCPDIQERTCGTVLIGELRDLLKEMLFPNTSLTTEVLSPVLLNQITEFLVSELQAAHMLKYRESHPQDGNTCSETQKEQRKRKGCAADFEEESPKCGKIEEDEGGGKEQVEEALTQLFKALDLDVSSTLSDAWTEVETRLASLPDGVMPEPLLKTNLNSSQWRKIEQINQTLSKDYECRRQMMMKRFHVTLQSFAWGEKGEERSAAVSSVPPLPSIDSCISVPVLLAVREDQSRILPVKAGPSTAVHKVLMGSVPDRGGRPGEIEPPMPSWSRRSEGGNAERSGRGKFQRREYSGKKKRNKKK